MTVLKPGSQLKSQVDDTQLIVVRAPGAEIDLTCGGHPMIDLKAEPAPGLEIKPESAGGSPLGKRFTDEAGTMELLITKAGEGTLATDGVALLRKEAKPLPSSD